MRFLTLTVNPSIDWYFVVNKRERGEIAMASGETRFPGGKGINAARILNRLGCETLALCAAGGASGNEFKSLLLKESLPHEVIGIQHETRRNLVMEELQGTRRKINFPGPRISPDEALKIHAMVMKHAAPGDMLLISGSLSPGMAVDFYRNIIKEVRSRKVLTALDTSGPALREAAAEKPDVIKMNLKELSSFLEEKIVSLDEAFQSGALLEHGRHRELLISAGNEGALLYAMQGCWRGSSPLTAEQMVVGCGDALLAGYVAARFRGATCPEALAFALSLATATAFAPVHELAGEKEASLYREGIVVAKLQ
jgi:1-phosphofructokinase